MAFPSMIAILMLHSCTQSAAFILAQSLVHEAEKQAVKKAKAEKRQAKKQAKAAAKAAARRATRETRAAKKLANKSRLSGTLPRPWDSTALLVDTSVEDSVPKEQQLDTRCPSQGIKLVFVPSSKISGPRPIRASGPQVHFTRCCPSCS